MAINTLHKSEMSFLHLVSAGVRYNAEKKKVGNYYTTPIFRWVL